MPTVVIQEPTETGYGPLPLTDWSISHVAKPFPVFMSTFNGTDQLLLVLLGRALIHINSIQRPVTNRKLRSEHPKMFRGVASALSHISCIISGKIFLLYIFKFVVHTGINHKLTFQMKLAASLKVLTQSDESIKYHRYDAVGREMAQSRYTEMLGGHAALKSKPVSHRTAGTDFTNVILFWAKVGKAVTTKGSLFVQNELIYMKFQVRQN